MSAQLSPCQGTPLQVSIRVLKDAHRAGKGDCAGLSNVPSLTVSPVTDNCVLTQLEFLQSLHKRGPWIAQTLCQPLRGSVWRRALSLTQGVHSLSIPHLKLESQPLHCSLWFSWTYDISIELKSLLLPVHCAAAQAWPFWLPHLGSCNNQQQYLEVILHDSCFCSTHASFSDFPLKISTFILKWW